MSGQPVVTYKVQTKRRYALDIERIYLSFIGTLSTWYPPYIHTLSGPTYLRSTRKSDRWQNNKNVSQERVSIDAPPTRRESQTRTSNKMPFHCCLRSFRLTRRVEVGKAWKSVEDNRAEHHHQIWSEGEVSVRRTHQAARVGHPRRRLKGMFSFNLSHRLFSWFQFS